jgi:hypothetical protein
VRDRGGERERGCDEGDQSQRLLRK